MADEPEGVRIRMYIGREREAQFWQDVQAIGEATLSPGGVAGRLQCSRQYVAKLLQKGELRAWMFKVKEGGRVTYCLIPLSDVEAYAKRVGRGEPAEWVDTTQPGVLG